MTVADLLSFCSANPGHVPAMMQLSMMLQEEGQSAEAVEILQRIIEIFPEDESTDSARTRLAAIYREQGQTELEIQQLQEQLLRCADDLNSAIRLQEVQQQREALERLPAQAAGQVSLRQERPRVAELGQSRSRSRLRSLSTAE